MARPRYHLLASAALGSAFWAATGRPATFAAPLLSGFLIDVDHLFDYALARTSLRGRVVLPLHGWEYVPAWLLVDRTLGLAGSLVCGYAVHLTIDQIWNEKRSRLAYLISWRARRGFKSEDLGARDPEKRHRWRQASPLGLIRWF
jgi:hypothetical protein